MKAPYSFNVLLIAHLKHGFKNNLHILGNKEKYLFYITKVILGFTNKFLLYNQRYIEYLKGVSRFLKHSGKCSFKHLEAYCLISVVKIPATKLKPSHGLIHTFEPLIQLKTKFTKIRH